jgi:S-adenosylmethionine:diacylglycerol 3-amino-3-carboxypropyl transferase
MLVRGIAAELGVAQSSVSTRVRDIKLTEDQRAVLNAERALARQRAVAGRKRVRPVAAPVERTGLAAVLARMPTQHGFRYHPTKTKGDITEAVALAFFTEAGFTPVIPMSENNRYDFIADDGVRLPRIQVR